MHFVSCVIMQRMHAVLMVVSIIVETLPGSQMLKACLYLLAGFC